MEIRTLDLNENSRKLCQESKEQSLIHQHPQRMWWKLKKTTWTQKVGQSGFPKIESYGGAVPETRFRRKISSNVITEWLKIGDELIQTQDWEGMRRESVVDATDDPLWLALTRSKPSMVRSDGGVTTAGNPFPGLRALFEGTGFFDTWSSVRSPSGTVDPG